MSEKVPKSMPRELEPDDLPPSEARSADSIPNPESHEVREELRELVEEIESLPVERSGGSARGANFTPLGIPLSGDVGGAANFGNIRVAPEKVELKVEPDAKPSVSMRGAMQVTPAEIEAAAKQRENLAKSQETNATPETPNTATAHLGNLAEFNATYRARPNRKPKAAENPKEPERVEPTLAREPLPQDVRVEPPPVAMGAQVPPPPESPPASRQSPDSQARPERKETVKQKKADEELAVQAYGLAEKAGVNDEREAMLEAERTYLAMRRERRPDKKELAALENEFNSASAVYEQKLQDTLEKRFDAKFAKPLEGKWVDEKPTNKDGSAMPFDEYKKMQLERFTRRYRGMVASRDVLDRSDKLLKDALVNKERGALEKGGKAIAAAFGKRAGEANAFLEKNLGKRGARAARIVGSAFVGAGAASFLGAGIAAFGLGAIGFRIARGTFGTVVGASVGGALGKLYAKTGGMRSAATLQAARVQEASGVEGIKAKREAYRKGNKAAIEKKRKYWEMGGAAAVGGLTTLGLYELSSIRGATETLAKIPEVDEALVEDEPENDVNFEDSVETPAAVAAVEAPPEVDEALVEDEPENDVNFEDSVETPAAVAESVPAEVPQNAPPVEAPPMPQIAETSVSIDTRGEGATKLFGHLKEALSEKGITTENVSPTSDAYYILTHTPDQSSLRFNFLTNDGSRIMQLGDTFKIDPDGKFDWSRGGTPLVPNEMPSAPSEVAQIPEPVPKPKVVEVPTLESAEVPREHFVPPTFESVDASELLLSPNAFPALVPADFESRKELIGLVASHGMGPNSKETVADFIARVHETSPDSTMTQGYRSFKLNANETHIYRDSNDHLVVFGGDKNAQEIIMTEYLRAHPNQSVFMNADKAGVMKAVPFQIAPNGQVHLGGFGVRQPNFFERLFDGGNTTPTKIEPKILKATVY